VVSSALHERVGELLVRDHQRYTSARRKLVEVLGAATHPLTIPEITRRDLGLAQSSTYRNLVVLERARAVQKVVANDEWYRYELAEELTDRHHHHLICSECGTVQDVEVPAALEHRLDEQLTEVASGAGFQLDHHRLDLVGRCADCA
jgi:Fe2+ or Zn2+ uptake regulation protein